MPKSFCTSAQYFGTNSCDGWQPDRWKSTKPYQTKTGWDSVVLISPLGALLREPFSPAWDQTGPADTTSRASPVQVRVLSRAPFAESKPQQTGTGLLIRFGEVATTSGSTNSLPGRLISRTSPFEGDRAVASPAPAASFGRSSFDPPGGETGSYLSYKEMLRVQFLPGRLRTEVYRVGRISRHLRAPKRAPTRNSRIVKEQ